VVVFSPSFSNAFLNFDDPANITHNDAIRAIDWQALRTYFTTPLIGMYSPLVYLSYAIDFRIGGLDVTVYHATNLLLHLLSVVLVWFIVRALSGHLATTAVVTALFAVHPVQVAAVVPLSIRSSLLYASFYLAAYLAYLSYIHTRSRLRLGLSLALFLLSLLSKSAAVVFPFLLILTDHYYRRLSVRTLVIEKVPFLLASLVFGIVGLSVRNDIAMMGGMLHYSILERVCLAAYGLVFYGFTLAAPFALSAFYSYPARIAGYLPLRVYLAPVALLAVVWMASRVKTERRLLAFGSLFFVIHILLVLKVVPLGLEFAADRYLYVASIGLFIVAAELCRRAPATIRKAGLVGLGATVALCSIASYGRSADWKDNVTFYTRILARDPGNAAAHNNLGRVLAADGKVAEAVPHFVEAVRLEPAWVLPHVNLGEALAAEGRSADAVGEFTEALRLDPSNAKAHGELGMALAQQGRAKEAIDHLAEAVRLDPAVVETRNNLGAALAGQGRLEEATAQYRAALALDPGSPEAHNNLGAALASQGRADEAIEQFSAALRANGGFVDARRNLGLAFATEGRDDDAIREFREALRIDPRLADVQFNLAVLLANAGNRAEAVEHLEMALKIQPADQAAQRLLDALSKERRK
jgi:tetratricopeptide (TPR) repeat protein